MRRRMLLYNAIIMIASLVMFILVWNQISFNLEVEDAKNSTVRELSLINNSLNLLIDTVNDYTISLSVDPRMLQAMASYNRISQVHGDTYEYSKQIVEATIGILAYNKNIIGSDVITKDGTILNMSELMDSEVARLYEMPELNQDIENQLVWSNLHSAKHMNGNTVDLMVIQKNIINPNTYEILGKELVYIDERVIANIFINDISNDEMAFYVVDYENNIVSSTDKSSINKAFNRVFGIEQIVLDLVVDSNSKVVDVENESFFISAQEVGKNDWYIISMIPMDSLSSSAKAFDKYIIIIGVLYLGVGSVVVMILTSILARPIEKLTRTMRKIEDGNRDIRASISTTKELKVLSDTFNSLMDSNETLMDQLYKEQEEIRQYQFKLIQAQIKPHFLYNTLETIASFIKLNMNEEALDSVRCLANFSRISLSDGKDIITIKQELKLVESYLTIQKYRNIKYLDFDFQIEPVIGGCEIPKFSLQPIVENAIYHGMRPKKQKTKVEISAYLEEGCIVIEVHDDGVGIDDIVLDNLRKQISGASEDESFGLHSVDSRIKIYYGTEYGLTIDSIKDKYTMVKIKLPYLRGENYA